MKRIRFELWYALQEPAAVCGIANVLMGGKRTNRSVCCLCALPPLAARL